MGAGHPVRNTVRVFFDNSTVYHYAWPVKKLRLDHLLLQRGLAGSRERAQALIRAGQVLVNDRVSDKPGRQVRADAVLRLTDRLPFVSRGGLKLQAALDQFDLDVANWVAVDVGASTGGFTDCLLQRGVVRVYAIDVGYGQLAWSLRRDARVVVMERTNIRYLERLPEQADIATVDVSFIGLELVLPVVSRLVKSSGHIVALAKPQFEAGRKQVGKGGVVRNPVVHRQVLTRLATWAMGHQLETLGVTPSPLRGPKGNAEFFVHFVRSDSDGTCCDWQPLVESALQDVHGRFREEVSPDHV
jgi:23S rRNA (cytidine1920-2'-O)/16S rRNA (cytidine1409-2'-O)-methyltransferase